MAWLVCARAHQALCQFEAAADEFGHVDALWPEHAAVLVNRALCLAEADRLEEAEACLRRALMIDRRSAAALANLGAVLVRLERPEEARRHLEAALALRPDLAAVHRNLAGILAASDPAAARSHRDAAYRDRSILLAPSARPQRRVLILVAADAGNVPLRHLLPRDCNTLVEWYVEYARADETPPACDVAFNAIGDPDLAPDIPDMVHHVLTTRGLRLLNDPARVAQTRRDRLPTLLAGIEGAVLPPVLRHLASDGSAITAIGRMGIDCPVLVRPFASHGGAGLRIATGPVELPEGDTYLMPFIDYAGPDGWYRKYRVIFVDGIAYPYHLAISPRWLVHYWTAGMDTDAERRAEEQRFLADPAGALGAVATDALTAIGRRLGLDYCGIDFSVLRDGRLLVFEANAPMLVHGEHDSIFAYRNPVPGKDPQSICHDVGSHARRATRLNRGAGFGTMNCDEVARALERARALAFAGNDEAAKLAYLAVLRLDQTQFDALNEIASLALASGHRSAARSAYTQAVMFHPDNPVGRVNLGNLLFEDGDIPGAETQFGAALRADPDLAEAHQGLGRVLAESSDGAADLHWRKGYAGHAVVTRPYRGPGPGVPLLLLVDARGGNTHTRQWLDERRYAVTAMYTEFFDPTDPLPPHAVVVNAIGDPDRSATALAGAEAVVALTRAPVINPPARIWATGRVENARRLAGVPGVIAPQTRVLSRTALLADGELRFPLLLRAPGFHTGQHFLYVADRAALPAAAAALPGERVLAIDYLDARGPDGMTRKYRVMFIDGVGYPLHLAISTDWKVHYFSACLATNAAYREEERRFLDDMPRALGAPAMDALAGIGAALGLDYAGVDFALAPDGSLLLFEANATMVVIAPDRDPIWDYRRGAVDAVLAAARRMLAQRAGCGET